METRLSGRVSIWRQGCSKRNNTETRMREESQHEEEDLGRGECGKGDKNVGRRLSL